jgi:hypothetical protein
MKVPIGLPEIAWESPDVISGLWELVWKIYPDVCPEIERLCRTSPEVWKELKTTSGQISSRNQ